MQSPMARLSCVGTGTQISSDCGPCHLRPSRMAFYPALRVQIAPGVSVGFQRGDGFGVKAEFGPGKKTDDSRAD